MKRAPMLWFSFLRPGDRTVTVRADTSFSETCWLSADVLTAVGVEGAKFRGHHTAPGWVDDAGEPVEFITTAEVARLAEEASAARFLTWLHEKSAAIEVHRAHRTAAPQRHHRTSTTVQSDEATGWTITHAAGVLSRDPVIDVGRRSLFDLLRNLGWIEQTNGAWIPTASSIRSGVTLRNDVWLPGTRHDYNRVRITGLGLSELHRHLGGVASVDTAAAAPALVEV